MYRRLRLPVGRACPAFPPEPPAFIHTPPRPSWFQAAERLRFGLSVTIPSIASLRALVIRALVLCLPSRSSMDTPDPASCGHLKSGQLLALRHLDCLAVILASGQGEAQPASAAPKLIHFAAPKLIHPAAM
jgi:hypothetical protein